MAKILLSNTYFLAFDPKQAEQMQPYPPLATLYVAALLRSEGHEISFSDTQFARGPEEVFPAILQHKTNYFVICDDGFNYLTKMCLVNMREACFAMIRYAKLQGCTVIISSSDATDHWKEYLDIGADYIVIGEAERTISELIAAIEANKNIAEVNGIAYRLDDQYQKSSPRAVLHNLDALPPPAWDLVDIHAYRQRWIAYNGYFSLNIATTRGCPFKCNWCAKPIYGNRYNSHSPEYVIEQIKILVIHFGATHIWFCDDIFGLKPGWIHAFRLLVEQEQLKFQFKIQCRADLLLNEDNIADLAASGCDEIWIGAESGSQMILDAMDKGTTIAQIKDSTRLMKKHSIKPCFFLQFGYPGETKIEIQQTIDMMLELMPHNIGISVSYPLPGTKFYEQVRADLQGKQNWNDSDELAMMFKGTYSADYYKNLHRYVHKLFRKAQAEQEFADMFSNKGSRNARRILLWPYYSATAFIHKARMKE
jgi:anaerobic magnesium-protoporphyrin IX monomethyl ester cyclase